LVLAPACIEPQQTNADATTDSTVTDLFLADTTCVPADCNDDDPCTVDWCDEATGTCQHAGVPSTGGVPAEPPPPACIVAADCDDGNPCTDDRCEVLSEECQVESRVCVNVTDPNCTGRCNTDSDCNDGLACTIDQCSGPGGTCGAWPLEGCVEGCRETGVLAPSDIVNNYRAFGTTVAARGTLGMYGPMQLCTDDGICNCEAPAALIEGGVALALSWNMASGGVAMPPEAWRCASRDEWEPKVSCAPGHAGVSYVAWGRATSWYMGGAPQDAAPAPQVDTLAVDGWCILPTVDGLSGEYSGALRPSLGGFEVGFDASLAGDNGALQMKVSNLQCLSGTCPETPAGELTVSVERFEMGGRFELPLAGLGSDKLVFRYFGDGNMLRGRWITSYAAVGPYWGGNDSGSGAEAPPPERDPVAPPAPEGTFELVRRAPTDPPAPCQ
jgi:hypothetical protein